VLVALGERVRQGRAGIADLRRDLLRAVQVAQRRIRQTGEDRRRNVADAADADVAFRLARDATGHEGVREHDHLRDTALLGVGADAA
jgi:hypothetical protein